MARQRRQLRTDKLQPSKHPAGKSWGHMWYRCTSPKAKAWPWYGGRGISVCERWRSFDAFVEDMGPRPPGTTIDRIDNDGNYEPFNCRWATPLQQNHNRRITSWVTIGGETRTLGEWMAVRRSRPDVDKVLRERRAALRNALYAAQAEEERAQARERRASRRAAGLCAKCKCSAAPGRAHCSRHLEMNAARTRKYARRARLAVAQMCGAWSGVVR